MKEAPIIFCHFGNSNYLQYTLESAKIHNPEKQVVLLGDNENSELAKRIGVSFYNYDDFKSSNYYKEFDKVYTPIQGKKHMQFRGKTDWLKFVFARWFFVFCFAEKYGITKESGVSYIIYKFTKPGIVPKWQKVFNDFENQLVNFDSYYDLIQILSSIDDDLYDLRLLHKNAIHNHKKFNNNLIKETNIFLNHLK